MPLGVQIPTGLNEKQNGPLTVRLCYQFGFDRVGCKLRGTTTCHDCPYAARIPRVCDYKCAACEDRWQCACGQDGQERLVMRLLELDHDQP